jgi:hypothetical protein
MILELVAVARLFHPVPLAEVPTTKWTHVQTQGTVALVKREDDGDIHIRLEDGNGHFIVAEIVPYHPLSAPALHACIVVRGITREDKTHKWSEIHPVEGWTPCGK